jgi:hypothetical protein
MIGDQDLPLELVKRHIAFLIVGVANFCFCVFFESYWLDTLFVRAGFGSQLILLGKKHKNLMLAFL